MRLHGGKLIQHIVMYFQARSNSAYPMHSVERYKTNGPLVICFYNVCFQTINMEYFKCFANHQTGKILHLMFTETPIYT